MKAIVLEKTCKAEDLKVSQVKIPEVVENRVLIKVKGFGINRSEVILRDYEADEPYIKLPRIPGIECVGEIIDPSNSSFEKGDIVCCLMGGMGRSFDGSYAEYASIPIKNTFKIEKDTLDKLSLEEIISIPETYFTAFGSLFECLNLKEEDILLVRGGTSAAGLSAIQLAKAMNCTVIATSRNNQGIAKLKEGNVDYAIIDNGEIEEAVLKACPDGADKILDLIGAKSIKDSFNCLKFRGILCITGILGGEEYIKNFDPITGVPNGKYLTGFYSNYPNQETIDNLFNFIISHNIKPNISKVFTDLEDIGKAHKLMENNEAHGKIVFKLEELDD